MTEYGYITRSFINPMHVGDKFWDPRSGTWGNYTDQYMVIPQAEADKIIASLAPFTIVYTCEFTPLDAEAMHEIHLYHARRDALIGTPPEDDIDTFAVAEEFDFLYA